MSKNLKISGKVLAIQLGREETQLILMNNGTEVLYSTVLSTPVGAVEDGVIRNPDAVKAMLKSALQEPELKRVRKAVFTLTTSQVISELVTTPNLSGAKLEKLILANADMYFPVDVKDYQLVWQPITTKASESGLEELLVQLWALPKAMLGMYYVVANDCGLSVLAIDYCGHSVATAVGATFAKPGKAAKKRPKLDLNMEIGFGKKKAAEEEFEDLSEVRGSTHTDMHILMEKDLLGMTCVQNGQVVFQRFIRCSDNPSYQLGELAMMVEYFRAMDAGRGSSIVGILSGSLSEDRELAAELADMMSVSLGLLDFPYDLKWVCCIGALNTSLDFGIPSLNKPGKAMQEMRSNLWQYALILVGGLMLISSVFSLLTARLNWSADIGIRQTGILALQAESQKYEGYSDKYDSYITAYNAYSTDWDNMFASLQTYNDNLVLVMDELEQILPEKSTVTDMQIGATGLNVTFACENKEQAAYIIMALRDMQYADLLAVSSLSGGGAGPATSYGSGKTGEKAPVEGGSDISAEDWERLYAALSADMDPYAVGYHMGMGQDAAGKALPDFLEDMAGVYAVKFSNTYSSLEEVPADFDLRTEVFRQMCTTNPFGMRAAKDMMYADYIAGGELSTKIKDSIRATWYEHTSPGDLSNDIKALMNVIYRNRYYSLEELFPLIEELIVQYEDAERWYIYYLEGALAGYDTMPCIDITAMTNDLADGEFNSGIVNSSGVKMDDVLAGMLSENTKAILEEITAEPECNHSLTHVQAVAPTCDKAGNVEYWLCRNCQSMWLDEAMTQPTTADAVTLPAAHTALTKVAAKEPTATQDGWHAHWHCTGCGGYWMDEALKVPTTLEAVTRPAVCTHSLKRTAAVKPTCDKAGNVEYWYCSICNTYWLDAAATKSTTLEKTVLAPEHQNVIAVPYKAPTETESGNYAYWHCTTCGGYWMDAELKSPTTYENLVIAPNGCRHTLKHIAAVEPTCDKAGNVEYWFCEKCELAWLDEALTQLTTAADTVLPAAHKDVVHVEYLAPTVTEAGHQEYWQCVACQQIWLDEAMTQPAEYDSVILPPLGETCDHKLVHEEAVEATCDQVGNLEYWYCEECFLCWLDEAMTQPTTLEAVGLPALEHSIVHVPAKEATETADGNLEHWYCEICRSYWLDEAMTQPTDAESVTIPATGEKDPALDAVMEKFAEVLDNYLQTGETGLTEAEEVLVQAALEKMPGYVPGTSIEEVLDQQLEYYFTYGKSDYSQFDKVIDAYLEANPDKEEELRDKYEKEVSIELALKKYLAGTDINYETVAILDYLLDGDSGENWINEDLDAFVTKGGVDDELTALLLADRDAIEKMDRNLLQVMENYDADKGNAVINARLKKCQETLEKNQEDIIREVVKYLKQYLKDGAADPRYDGIIRNFLLNGSFGKDKENLDKIFNDHIKGGNVDEELTRLIYLYVYQNNVLQNSQYASSGILQMMNKYHKEGGTGSKDLDDRIKYCYEVMLRDYIQKLAASKTGGSAQPQEEPDTRTFFTVVLAYNSDLMSTELERKGLDYEDKIPLIKEVGEE